LEIYDYLEKYCGIKLYPYQKIMLNMMTKIPNNLFTNQFYPRRDLYSYKLYSKLFLGQIPLYPKWMYIQGEKNRNERKQ